MKSPRDYVLTREDWAMLQSLKPGAELARKLADATIVRSETVPPDVVTMQTRFTYIDEATGIPRIVTLAYPRDAFGRRGRLSVRSMLGTALLGASSGRTVSAGAQRLRVGEVLYQPERALYGLYPAAR